LTQNYHKLNIHIFTIMIDVRLLIYAYTMVIFARSIGRSST